MQLCHSWSHIPLKLSATKRYTPDQIREFCRRATGPFWLKVEGTLIAVHGEQCLMLACHACAAHHDWVAYNAPLDDGFEADMAEREEIIKARLEEPINSEDSDFDGW
jgi:hypothetical protein